jgi:predicted phosphate transport protein (TIGR00153 family)
MPKSRLLSKLRRLLGGERTTLEGAIDAMGREREEQVLERMAQFIDQVVVIVEKLQDVVERFAADRYEELAEAAKELDKLESRADDTKEVILDQVSLGGVFPIHRADLARLVGSMDSIANLATGAADRISMRKFTLPKEMNEQLVALAKVDVEATRALREAVVAMGTDLHQAIKLAGSVDKIESRADDLYASMYRYMFDMDIDFKAFHQLKSILDRLENIADRCSDNAELLRHMALEYLEDA